MDELIEDEGEMLRSIRPSEAVKAYQVIENSAAKVVAEKARMWTSWTTKLGPFIRDRTANAKRKAGSTRGSKYAAAMKDQMKQFYPIYQKLSENGTLSYLARVMDELEAIEAWRSKLPEEERPTHPMRVWLGYEASVRPIIQIDAEAEEDDDEENGNVEETLKKKAKRAARRKDDDAKTQRHIEELEEKISRLRMTIDPGENAQRFWRAHVEAFGHPQGIPIFKQSVKAVVDLLDRIETEFREAEAAVRH